MSNPERQHEKMVGPMGTSGVGKVIPLMKSIDNSMNYGAPPQASNMARIQ